MSFAATFTDANWISMGGIPGVEGSVYAAAVDGSGNLYIGGYFVAVGDNIVGNVIAKWNGSSWSALGSGIGGGVSHAVYALAVSGSDLYAGGDFTTAGGIAATNIAKWNGTNWSALGSGLDGYVYAMAVSGNDLYVGGNFDTAGAIAAASIAKWDGNGWSALGSGVDRGVDALAVSGNDLYAGGDFLLAGGNPANRIAKWDGSTWSPLSSGLENVIGPTYVSALAVSGSDLYVGGNFAIAGGIPASFIAQWDGSSWSPLGSAIGSPVLALAVSGTDLYAGGDSTMAKWDGNSWSALGAGSPSVQALAASGSNVYAGGGGFATADGVPATGIAKWDGSSWWALGSGLAPYGRLVALEVSGSNLYAGGKFTTTAGGIAANYIAHFDGTTWSALGSGMSGDTAVDYPYVSALAVSGSSVYAGGYFTNAGGVAANHIARWDGSNWSALGSGMGGADNQFQSVFALAVLGSDLYAGGHFTTAGGSSATNIAKWNGSSWSALGSGINTPVHALAVSGSDLYAGGQFWIAGGNPANYVAKWNGTNWSGLGLGIGGGDAYGPIVNALAVSGSDVYAGGHFTTAGGIPANHIAKWNGTNWSALGSGLANDYTYPWVYALAVSGRDVYAGGVFTTAGGSPANFVAKWDGTTWSALGTGMGDDTGYVYALALSGSYLYAGGAFITAGGKVSAYLAKAIVNPPILAIEQDGFGGYFINFSGVPGSAYRLQRAPSVTGAWTTSAPQTAPASGFLQFWDFLPPPGQGFYRTVQPEARETTKDCSLRDIRVNTKDERRTYEQQAH